MELYTSDLTKIGYKKYKSNIAIYDISNESECVEQIDDEYTIYRKVTSLWDTNLIKLKERYPQFFNTN